MLCRNGKAQPCDCDKQPGGACCPTPFTPITTGDCGNRWRLHVTFYGINNTTTAPDYVGHPTVGTWRASIPAFDGSLAGPAACVSCAVVNLRTEATAIDCSSGIEFRDQETWSEFGFMLQCPGRTQGTRTDVPPFTNLVNLDLNITTTAENRWRSFPNYQTCFLEGALGLPGLVRFLPTGSYTPAQIGVPWNATVTHEWGIDAGGHGFWDYEVTAISSLGETVEETVSVIFWVETIEACPPGGPTQLPTQPCADIRYWVLTEPCPGTPFTTPVYALVSPLDPCGILHVPDTQVCVIADPGGPQFPSCPPGAICLIQPIDPDITTCCQCVEGCESDIMRRGDLCPTPPETCCVTEDFPVDRCCCHDEIAVVLRGDVNGTVASLRQETNSLGVQLNEYRIQIDQNTNLREAHGTLGDLPVVLEWWLNGVYQPGWNVQVNLAPGCAWRSLGPRMWTHVDANVLQWLASPNPFGSVNAPADVALCIQANMLPGWTVNGFGDIRRCGFRLYTASWTWLNPGPGDLRREDRANALRFTLDPDDSSHCSGGCPPIILPASGKIKAATAGGCAGCGKGGGL